MSATEAHDWRELDYRQADGGRLRVRLLWNQHSHNLALEVNDRGIERVLALRDPSAARTRSCTRSRTCGDGPDAAVEQEGARTCRARKSS